MIIGGLQKTTLLDFPGRVSALVFTQGCNFLCPYCHNPELISGGQGAFSVADILAFLDKRKNVLEGLVISGGEPTLHEDLPDFCRTVKALGYAIKLDTNGSHPDMLEDLLAEGLLDYVAMDIKADPSAYSADLCSAALRPAIVRSIALIKDSGLEHEFRVTCVSPFVNQDLGSALIRYCADSPVYFQIARLDNVLNPGFFANQGQAMPDDEIAALVDYGLAHGQKWLVR